MNSKSNLAERPSDATRDFSSSLSLPLLGVSSLDSEPTANITLRCRGFLSTGQMLAHKLKRRAWSLRRAGFSYYKVRKMIEAMRNEI